MYIGVRALIEELKEPFDRIGKATKKARKVISDRGDKVNKELLEEETNLILAEWDRKRNRGIDVQKQICEKEIKKDPTIILEEYSKHDGTTELNKSECLLKNKQTYLEKKLFSNKYKVIGYADKIVVSRNTINIYDNKIIDKIYRTSSFKTDNGFKIPPTKMSAPLDHLEDCNYNEYVLQLSLYMYLAWENNKSLKIGKLYIRHIIMNDKDKITSDELIEVPYMKEEVKKILKYRLLNES